MSQGEKLLNRMRRNPAGNWTIQDIQRLCDHLGWSCLPPMGGGSHWKIAAPGHDSILTVPAKRPIKAICIRKLMELVKAVNHGTDD